MRQQKVIMTKGLPASGKSTWAKEQVQEFGYKRINKNDLRSMVDCGAWSKSNEKVILSIRDELLRLLLTQDFSVIVDDTNLVKKHEDNIRQIANEFGATFELKDFTDVPLGFCIQRDKKRHDYVGEDVIRRMYREHIESPAPKFVLEPDPRLPLCIIVDLDGTIANNTGVRNWNNFNDVYLDATHDHILAVISALLDPHCYEIFLFSGREGTQVCYEETVRWIRDKVVERFYPIRSSIHRHGLNLVMRKEKDYRKDAIVKQEMYEAHIKSRYNVLAVFDDRNQVVDMWRSLGLPTLQVAPGDF